MRTFIRDHWKAIVAIILLVVLALFTVSPGAGAPAPSLATRLRAHVAATAGDAHGPPARYVAATLRADGYAVRSRQDGGARALEVSLSNLAPHTRPQRLFIVGAHRGDGSATAAVLELARLLKDLRPSLGTELRFVFFDDDAKAAQPGPDPAPDEGSFVAFVGAPAASRQVQQALAAFQGAPGGPARGLATPAYVQGETLCAACGAAGTPAVMVTHTAFMRDPYYEATAPDAGQAADPAADDAAGGDQDEQDGPPDRFDYAGIARVLTGLAHTIEALAAAQQG